MAKKTDSTIDDELTAQLILVFYGADALQEYRADKSLVPITVYQMVKSILKNQTQAIRKELTSLLAERVTLDELTGTYDRIMTKSVEAVPASIIQARLAALDGGSDDR